jgi:hypothetical protein
MAVLLIIDVDSVDDLDTLHDQSMHHDHCMIVAQRSLTSTLGGPELSERNQIPIRVPHSSWRRALAL